MRNRCENILAVMEQIPITGLDNMAKFLACAQEVKIVQMELNEVEKKNTEKKPGAE